MTFARTALLVAAGPIVWALHFAFIYGFAGVACARGLAVAVPWALAAATPVAAAACVAVAVSGWRHRGRFEHWLSACLAAAALLAIVWEALPAIWVAPCA